MSKAGTAVLDALTRDGGFTLDPRTGDLVKIGSVRGYAIAVPGTERVVGRDTIDREKFAAAFADLIVKYGDDALRGRYIGGWHSIERGVYLIELSEILTTVSRAHAVGIGRKRGQEAILNMVTGEEIRTR